MSFVLSPLCYLLFVLDASVLPAIWHTVHFNLLFNIYTSVLPTVSPPIHFRCQRVACCFIPCSFQMSSILLAAVFPLVYFIR